MKPETTLSKQQMENFSINVVNNLEGCAEAIVFLKKIYGEEIINLRERRADFVSLAKMGKAHWIINFLLNTITKPYRIKYINQLIHNNIYLVREEELKKYIRNAMVNLNTYTINQTDEDKQFLLHDYYYLTEERNLVKEKIASIGNDPMQIDQFKFQSLMVESQFLKAVLFTLDDIEGTITRSSVSFCQSLAESIQWKHMGQDDNVDHNKKTLEDCAVLLIDYVGYFVKTI